MIEDEKEGGWGFIYHLVMSSYGWTISDVDELTYPQLKELLKQIQRYPPSNMIQIESMRARTDAGRDRENEMNMSRIPYVQDIRAKSSNLDSQRITRTGSKMKKIVRKKDGKEIFNG